MRRNLPNRITKNNHKILGTGFTLIELMVVVGIIALLAAVSIPVGIKVRMVANEATAKATLHSIANAMEMYLAANSIYPTTESDLLSPAANPPYLDHSYDNQTLRGYKYNFQFDNSYTVIATPQTCGSTGSKTFTLNQSIITETACTP